jgi:hypothetical protein
MSADRLLDPQKAYGVSRVLLNKYDADWGEVSSAHFVFEGGKNSIQLRLKDDFLPIHGSVSCVENEFVLYSINMGTPKVAVVNVKTKEIKYFDMWKGVVFTDVFADIDSHYKSQMNDGAFVFITPRNSEVALFCNNVKGKNTLWYYSQNFNRGTSLPETFPLIIKHHYKSITQLLDLPLNESCEYYWEGEISGKLIYLQVLEFFFSR